MNIYLLERTDDIRYDESAWFVVSANNEEEVRAIVSDKSNWDEGKNIWLDKKTRCLIIWTTEFYHKPTIILEDFRAW